MKHCVYWFSFVFAVLALTGCGHPTTEMVFSTSTDAYPLSTEDSAALAELGASGSGVPVTSVARIRMQGIADTKMQAVWLEALVLQASEGDLGFIQLARCYVQAKGQTPQPAVLVGTARAENLSDDARSIKFEVNKEQDLSGILRSPFDIVISIEGGNPTGKVSVSAELKLKSRIML